MQFSSPTGLSDRIRDYVERTWIRPARESDRSRVTIRAGDIHSKMGLRFPAPAGMIRWRAVVSVWMFRVPRARGDDPPAAGIGHNRPECSPRPRG